METIWQTAIGLTGIAGVGALVLYALYKDWLQLTAVATLSRQQRFSLFKLFLILTFLFAASSLGLAAYRSHLGQQAAQASSVSVSHVLDSSVKIENNTYKKENRGNTIDNSIVINSPINQIVGNTSTNDGIKK